MLRKKLDTWKYPMTVATKGRKIIFKYANNSKYYYRECHALESGINMINNKTINISRQLAGSGSNESVYCILKL